MILKGAKEMVTFKLDDPLNQQFSNLSQKTKNILSKNQNGIELPDDLKFSVIMLPAKFLLCLIVYMDNQPVSIIFDAEDSTKPINLCLNVYTDDEDGIKNLLPSDGDQKKTVQLEEKPKIENLTLQIFDTKKQAKQLKFKKTYSSKSDLKKLYNNDANKENQAPQKSQKIGQKQMFDMILSMSYINGHLIFKNLPEPTIYHDEIFFSPQMLKDAMDFMPELCGLLDIIKKGFGDFLTIVPDKKGESSGNVLKFLLQVAIKSRAPNLAEKLQALFKSSSYGSFYQPNMKENVKKNMKETERLYENLNTSNDLPIQKGFF